MKRFITAISLAMLSVPAFAIDRGAPYEQLNVDRALPQIPQRAVQPFVADSSAPYEQLTIDRALPNLPQRDGRVAPVGDKVRFAGSGSTRSDASPDPIGVRKAPSPWANDHNFISPAP